VAITGLTNMMLIFGRSLISNNITIVANDAFNGLGGYDPIDFVTI
jgi:hypothetical protein